MKGESTLMKKGSLYRIAVMILVMGLLFTASCGGEAPEPTPTPKPEPGPAPTQTPAPKPKPKTYSEPPPMVIDKGKQYTATIETEKGNLELELFAKDVPVTVNNFVFLVRDGFYDGTTFHRVIAGFMAQGGDPTGTGRGNPGYRFKDEFTSHTHVTGALSMANSGPNTNGCQFFITYAPQHGLDGKHSVFGLLTKGMDVLQKIKNDDVMIRVTIEEK